MSKMRRVFLVQDIENVGMAHEIVKVSDGYATNYLIPRKLGIEVTEHNEQFFKKREKTIEKRNEVIASKTSMLSERIKSLSLTLRRKLHDDGKLYGSISPAEIVDLLAANDVSIAKNQVIFEKSIKAKGSYEITIKLSSRLQPKFKLNVIGE
jgi:large subunit ribosomal protein L9